MISFCIPYRPENTYREKSFKFVNDALEAVWFPENEIIITDISDNLDFRFSRSMSRNAAANLATGSILVFVDADSFVPVSQIITALNMVGTEKLEWCFPYTTYYSLNELGSRRFMTPNTGTFNEERDADYTFPGPDPNDRPASVGGCVVVSRSLFEDVGGYDERFIGWGFEDRAFAYSLETFSHGEARIEGNLFHLWHPEPESDRFGQRHMEYNRALANKYLEAIYDKPAMRGIINGRN